MPLDLYYDDISPACRPVRLLCKSLNINVNLKPLEILKGDTRTEQFRKMNHHHCVPTIDDDGFYLWQSRTVMRYLADKFDTSGQWYPKDPKKRAEVDRVLDYDANTIDPAVSQVDYPAVMLLETPTQDAVENLDMVLEELEASPTLWKESYLCGAKPTLADLSLSSTLSLMEACEDYYDSSKHPQLEAWRERVRALPFYKECYAGFEAFKVMVKSPEFKASVQAEKAAEGQK